jgi:hypothetical protein
VSRGEVQDSLLLLFLENPGTLPTFWIFSSTASVSLCMLVGQKIINEKSVDFPRLGSKLANATNACKYAVSLDNKQMNKHVRWRSL